MAYNNNRIDDTAPVGTILRGLLGNSAMNIGVPVYAIRVSHIYLEDIGQIRQPGWHTMYTSDGSGSYYPSGEALLASSANYLHNWTEVFRPRWGDDALSPVGRFIGRLAARVAG